MVFFAKKPAEVEIINDTNGDLINFYRVVRQDFPALEREIAVTLHSRKLHDHAWVVYKNPDLFDPIKRARAVWMLANSSYGKKLDGDFGYDRHGTAGKKMENKRTGFTRAYADRPGRVQIECRAAPRIIQSRDTPDAFFYLDPPYVGAFQGRYDGYTQEDFDMLLGVLENLKGKFLLSSYRNKRLTEYA